MRANFFKNSCWNSVGKAADFTYFLIISVETTTLQHEDIYERHHYEYTIPEIKTIEANTINYENENFRHHTESDLDESSNR